MGIEGGFDRSLLGLEYHYIKNFKKKQWGLKNFTYFFIVEQGCVMDVLCMGRLKSMNGT